jgi:hypothetical protein
MTEAINRINTVRAVGTLDRQRAGRGRELLACEPGIPLRADGTLEWLQREDPRYALSPTERGRRIVEVQFWPQRIIPAI